MKEYPFPKAQISHNIFFKRKEKTAVPPPQPQKYKKGKISNSRFEREASAMFTENTIGLSDQRYSCLQIQKHFKIAYLILANKKKVVHGSSSNPIKDAVRVFLSREARMDIQKLKSEDEFKRRRLPQCSAAAAASWFEEQCIDLIFLTYEEGQSRGVAKSH